MSKEELVEKIQAFRANLIIAQEDANNDAPLADNEYYESDEYYESAIETLTAVLKLAEEN